MPASPRKEDRRAQYTKQLIIDTFLQLLNKKPFPKITVTEICRLAEINRGTFYLHYYDILDVLNAVFDEMLKDTSSALDHVLCPDCTSNCSYPFCEKIHGSPRYRAIFLDDALTSAIIEKMAETGKEGYVTWLMSHSLLTFEDAESVFYFQMNGCLAVNRLMLRNHCTNWKQIQKTIDTFIKAGLESFLIHDRRDDYKGELPGTEPGPNR